MFPYNSCLVQNSITELLKLVKFFSVHFDSYSCSSEMWETIEFGLDQETEEQTSLFIFFFFCRFGVGLGKFLFIFKKLLIQG